MSFRVSAVLVLTMNRFCSFPAYYPIARCMARRAASLLVEVGLALIAVLRIWCCSHSISTPQLDPSSVSLVVMLMLYSVPSSLVDPCVRWHPRAGAGMAGLKRVLYVVSVKRIDDEAPTPVHWRNEQT